ncbi:MAG: hypothetical protein ACK5MH_09120 [Bacteroidales bacterium]
MKKYIVITIIILLAFGCKTQKPIVITEYQTKIIKEVVKDTVIDVQIKEMFIEKQTKDTLSELSTNNAFSRAFWSNGILFHSLEQKGIQPTKITYKDILRIDTILQVKNIEIEKKLGWWDNMFIWIGRTLFWGLIIGFVGFIFWIFRNK